MSYALQDAVWASALPGRLRLTALAMASFADDRGERCRPAQETVAVRTGHSLRKVRNDIDELVELGVLQVLSVGRQGRASRYHFHAVALPAATTRPVARLEGGVAPPPDLTSARARPPSGNRQGVTPTATGRPSNRHDVPVPTGNSGASNRQNPSSQPAPGATDPIRGSDQGIRSSDPVRTHTPRARGRAPGSSPVSDAIRELRETYEVAAIWTREDGDEVHAFAEFVRLDDVSRTGEEVKMARRPSWPLARAILRRVAAARREGRDPWAPEERPRPPARTSSSRAAASRPPATDPYAHLYRRD